MHINKTRPGLTWQCVPDSSFPAAHVPLPRDTLAIFLQERTADLERGLDSPSLTFVIPKPSPGHAMFIRLPQTAMESVAPDERECCVHEGEQTVCTVWLHVVLNHIKFSNLSRFKIGWSLIFQPWTLSQCKTITVVSCTGLYLCVNKFKNIAKVRVSMFNGHKTHVFKIQTLNLKLLF